VLLDTGGAVVTGQKQVIGYYSWGSNDPAVHQRTFDLSFVPGAIGAMFVSTDGRTFTAPPEKWNVGTWDKPDTFHAGSPQSLAGDLIRAGITGVAGHVAEPYLDATIRPDILFPAYVSGFNLAEAFYLAMPYLSWQTVVVGDPLCTPFPRTWAPQPTALEPPLDQQTQLPRFFMTRRIAATTDQATGGLKRDAILLGLRGETLLARGDKTGAREALEQATSIDPSFNGAHLAVASLYEETQEYDKAVTHYRRMVANSPNDIIGLNNLAFALGARLNKPAEAIYFAERAYELSQGSPVITDTYAWVLHLNGNDQQAARYATDAAAGAPGIPEIQWHYAVIMESVGEKARAEKALAKAIELNPNYKSVPEVQALQKKLSAR
jgi:Tfp pilus assembly protein PilF